MTANYQRIALCFVITSATLTLLEGCGTRHEAAIPSPSTMVGPKIDDNVISNKVRVALLGEPSSNSGNVTVDTRKGIVHLSGSVDNQIQVDRAIELANAVRGVKDVQSKVKINARSEALDSAGTTHARAGLLVDTNDAGGVTRKVESQGSGFLDNRSELDHAIEISRRIDGVQSTGNK